MKKELIIFSVVLILFALVQHPDILTAPIERLKALPTSGAYGIGAFHPIIFAMVGYLFIAVLRGIYKGISKIFIK